MAYHRDRGRQFSTPEELSLPCATQYRGSKGEPPSPNPSEGGSDREYGIEQERDPKRSIKRRSVRASLERKRRKSADKAGNIGPRERRISSKPPRWISRGAHPSSVDSISPLMKFAKATPVLELLILSLSGHIISLALGDICLSQALPRKLPAKTHLTLYILG